MKKSYVVTKDQPHYILREGKKLKKSELVTHMVIEAFEDKTEADDDFNAALKQITDHGESLCPPKVVSLWNSIQRMIDASFDQGQLGSEGGYTDPREEMIANARYKKAESDLLHNFIDQTGWIPQQVNGSVAIAPFVYNLYNKKKAVLDGRNHDVVYFVFKPAIR